MTPDKADASRSLGAAPIEYQSQFGQDRFVDQEVFQAMRGGVFVEIGAHDGKTLSNTYTLEKERGWTGVLVEPLPSRADECRKTRSATVFQGCVASSNGMQPFTAVEGADMLSGLGSHFPSGHRDRIENVEKQSAVEIEVECIRFDDLMARCGITRIDYCSIDTEGSELQILRTIDFDKYRPTCFSIEDNGRKLAIRAHLLLQGYRFVKRLGADLAFVEWERARSMGPIGWGPWDIAGRIVAAVRRLRRKA